MNLLYTPQFRASYPHLLKPKLNTLSKKEEYSVAALFPVGTDFSALKAAAQEAIIRKWGADKSFWPQNLKLPFKEQGTRFLIDKATNRPVIDANGKPVLQPGYEAGGIFMDFKSTERPGVVNERVELVTDPNEIYAGCWCIAQVRVGAYDNAGNRGVSFYLQNLQKVKDGEPLGTVKVKATDAFKPIVDPSASAGMTGSAADLFK